MPSTTGKRKPSLSAVKIGDYYTDGRRLMSVTGVEGTHVWLEDCVTEKALKRTARVLAAWTKVKPSAS